MGDLISARYAYVSHPVDSKTMNIKLELEKVSKNPAKQKIVKHYLLDCCAKLVRFRSSGRLPKNLQIAKKFLSGFANQKEIHQAEWELEGEAFGVEYFSQEGKQFYFRARKDISADLVKVRISKGLSNNASRKYLEDMAYFIDRVFSHIECSSNWLFREECEKFMCPKLYKKYFGVAA
ncbi:hypothetical protein [Grimontia sp. NTOU-MAR1]|uniref:hypothetical protein n=1 Tax=Grimontia sp. NTOU-MAR1 TaxID=3111011 RepID=UPI002DBD3743|nr:hypothetical protein [Grimontia sp. NTOU-MAR1]WRV97957.1 hypothetical protein VP504_00515 [Grimontia sp. NTOU-MAR1]